MQLTTEQLLSLDHGQPIPVVVGGRSCVLLSDAAYEQVRELIEDWHPSTMQRHMAGMMAEDWSDPAMNVYDE